MMDISAPTKKGGPVLTILLVLFIGACAAAAQISSGNRESWWPAICVACMGGVIGGFTYGHFGGVFFYGILSYAAWGATMIAVPEQESHVSWSPGNSALHNPSQGETCQFCAGEVPGDACIYCGTRKGEKIPPGEATGATVDLAQITDCCLYPCDEPGVHYLFGKKEWCLCRTHFFQAKEKIERAVAANPSKARFDHAKDALREMAPLLFSHEDRFSGYHSRIRW